MGWGNSGCGQNGRGGCENETFVPPPTLLLPCHILAEFPPVLTLIGFTASNSTLSITHTHTHTKGSKALKMPQLCKGLTMVDGEVGGDGHRRARKARLRSALEI